MYIPTISILVPYFNSEKYIHRCIESIINQTLKEIELILIDDGSTDNSYRICEKYAENDNRIILLKKENGGQGTARNLGLDIAKGKYIGFVDSDDFIELNMYELMFEKIEHYNADISICGYNIFNKLNDKLIPNKYEFKELILDNKTLMKEYLTKSYITGGPCNKLYSRELFSNLRFPSIRMREDSYLMPHIFQITNKAVFIGENLYNQYIRIGSTERSSFSVEKLDALKSVDSLEEIIIGSYPDLIQYVFIRKIQSRFELLKNIILSKSIDKYHDIYKNLYSEINSNLKNIDKSSKSTLRIYKNLFLSKLYYFYYKCMLKLAKIKNKRK